jgi:hypothetical protein
MIIDLDGKSCTKHTAGVLHDNAIARKTPEIPA